MSHKLNEEIHYLGMELISSRSVSNIVD